MTPAHPTPRRAGMGLTLVLAGLSMFGPFSIDTAFPAFQQMGAELEVGSTAMQQVVSVYLLAFAIMSLVHGPLSDAVGRRPVMVAGIAVFVLASVGCALSASLPVLLVCRALQGFSAGAGQIVSRAVVRDLFDGPEAQRLMSHVAMIFGVAPAIAPIIGGALLGLGRWPLVFWFLAAFGLLMAGAVLLVLPETHPPKARTPLRLGAAVGSLVRIARGAAFWRIALACTLTFAGQFLYIAGAPIFVVDLLGLGSGDFWLFFVPMIGCMVTGAFVSGRLAGRITGRTQVMVGMTIALASGVLTVVLAATPDPARLPWPVVGPSLMALGVAMAFPVLQLAVLDLHPDARGSAASASSFVQLAFNAALAGVVVPVATASLLSLALTSLLLIVLGTGVLGLHLLATRPRAGRGLRTTRRPEPLEPTDRM